jgi:phosphatidate phosphatase APP1
MHLDPSRSVVSSAASPNISSGADQASSLTTSLSPATIAMQEVETAVTPAGMQCIKQVVERLAPGATVTVTTVNAPPMGDKSTGIHFSASNSTGSFVGENFFIAKGNQEITVQFTGTNAAFPVQVERSSLRKLAARLG